LSDVSNQLSDVSNLIGDAHYMLAQVEAQYAPYEHEVGTDQEEPESADSFARENRNMVDECARIDNQMDECRKNIK
jgi:hypothetical protein